MTEQEVLDRLEVLRQRNLKLYFDYTLLSKSKDITTKTQLESLKNEIEEVQNEFKKLMVKKSQINLKKQSKL